MYLFQNKTPPPPLNLNPLYFWTLKNRIAKEKQNLNLLPSCQITKPKILKKLPYFEKRGNTPKQRSNLIKNPFIRYNISENPTIEVSCSILQDVEFLYLKGNKLLLVICNCVSAIVRGGVSHCWGGGKLDSWKEDLMDKLLTLHEASYKCWKR